MTGKIRQGLKGLAQRILFSFEQFARHELANHAAAGAYSFLLSAIPALLVVTFLSASLARFFNLDMNLAARLISPYIEAFGGEDTLKLLFGKASSLFAGAFGFINLIWASRLFVVSIQRGLRVVYQDAARINLVRENILTFVVELLILLALVALIAASQIVKAMSLSLNWMPIRQFLGASLPFLLKYTPGFVLFVFIFLTFRNIPPKKPRTKTAVLAAALCLLFYIVLAWVLGLFISTKRYGLLYGLLGNLVIGLIKVYFFFWLYFFFAEFMFTIDNFDSLLFGRFHSFHSRGEDANAIERFLFSEPGRLMKLYSKQYNKGEIIFSSGDPGKDAYYLYKGRVNIFLDKTLLSIIREGEFFGELATVLDEERSATAIAARECTVFKLPAAVFRRFITQDREASNRLVELMAARLKANNELIKEERAR